MIFVTYIFSKLSYCHSDKPRPHSNSCTQLLCSPPCSLLHSEHFLFPNHILSLRTPRWTIFFWIL